MKEGWTLDDIPWDQFAPERVDRQTLEAVKAAAMVEFNAADYVAYLERVFAGDEAMIESIRRWGVEETQHGRALARWAEMADPAFRFDPAFARFREGYRPAHFESGEAARGGRAGEMIARCVVESGTSSFYSGIRDETPEPVLKVIAAHIAADEFRHYRLFYEAFLKYQPEERLSFLERARVAVGRLAEAEDDELAYAFYAANIASGTDSGEPYDRDTCSREYNRRVLRFYRPQHVKKAVQMILKPVGLSAQSRITRAASRLLWWELQARGRSLGARAA
ncbi:MAG: ferritin-like domain-containing protein [Alphaproteobacteria bacterium]|nr:ferritin-like domain-containing protein [Alphaproteobacteria bacterium]